MRPRLVTREAETRPKRRKESKRHEARKKEGMKRRGEEGRWGNGGSRKRAQTSARGHICMLSVQTWRRPTVGGSESRLWNQLRKKSEKWTFDGCIFGLLLLTSFPACGTGNLSTTRSTQRPSASLFRILIPNPVRNKLAMLATVVPVLDPQSVKRIACSAGRDDQPCNPVSLTLHLFPPPPSNKQAERTLLADKVARNQYHFKIGLGVTIRSAPRGNGTLSNRHVAVARFLVT